MYAKIFSSLYQGTLRGRSNEILVFTNLLAHASKDGIVDKHWRAIAEETGLTVDSVRAAIIELESPDLESRSPEEDGARIIQMDGHRAWGWQIVNHAKYRAMRSEDDRAEQNRLAQKRWRENQKDKVITRKPSVSTRNTDKPMQKQMQKQKQESDAEASVSKAIASSCAGFEDFWQAYPKKLGKVGAQKSFKAAIKTATLEEMLNAIQSQKQTDAWTKDHGQFIPWPATWLNRGDWMNEVQGQTKAPKPAEVPEPANWQSIYEPMDDRAYYDPDGVYEAPEWSKLTSKEKVAVIAATKP